MTLHNDKCRGCGSKVALTPMNDLRFCSDECRDALDVRRALQGKRGGVFRLPRLMRGPPK